MDLLGTALGYAARGIPVFPCNAKKKPLTKHGFKDASVDPVQVNRLFANRCAASIAMPTGNTTGFDVLDVDKKDGKDGTQHLPPNWMERCPILIQTPSGGYHAFFRADRAGTHQEGVGLDWRDDGGYVVVSPGYTVIKGEWPCDPQTLPIMPPEFRYEAFNREQPTAEEKVTKAPRKVTIEEIKAALDAIPADCPEDVWWKVAAALRNELGDDGFEIFHDWSATGGDRYKGEQDCRNKWEASAKKKRIRIGTLFWYADECDSSWRDKLPVRAKRKISEQAAALVSSMGLFHNPHGDRFIAVPQESGGTRNLLIASTDTADLLQYRYYKAYNTPLSEHGLKETRALLEARARFEGPCRETYLRVAHHDGAVFIDLGQDNARVVHITADGWTVTTDCPVAFTRPPGLGALPDPVSGNITDLQKITGLGDSPWRLLLAFLINAVGPGPYACALIDGEHGSGKTFTCFVAKHLIDPNAVETLRLPKNEHDLMIQASDNWVLSYDNVSGVKWNMSDALSALATGSGYSTRRYYTDNASRTFTHRRPFIINGIGEYASREDLLDRAIPISLPPLNTRRTELDMKTAIAEALPGLLGGLYDLVSCALRNSVDTPTPTSLRMADAAKWIVAAEPATGLPKGTLLSELEEVRDAMTADRVMDTPLAINLLRVVEKEPFKGLVSTLLDQLLNRWDERDQHQIHSAAKLSTELTRIKPVAAKAGLHIILPPRTKRGRRVEIRYEPPKQSEPKPDPEESQPKRRY